MKDSDLHRAPPVCTRALLLSTIQLSVLLLSGWAFNAHASEKLVEFIKYKNYIIPLRTQPDGACLYNEIKYKGDRVCFTQSQPTLDVNWDNQASSIGLDRDYYAIAYDGPNYTGIATVLNDESSDLDAINNTISSIQIGLADEDGDGVHALDDLCADTPGGESVNADGCSATQIDTDGDGVMDAYDMCAATVAGGTVDIFGCTETQDGDGDGIANENDSYPYQSVSQCTP